VSSSAAERKSILIVDDDADSRQSLREFLEYRGYQVACAEDGQVGLEQIETAEMSPGLILLDLIMPAMDGWPGPTTGDFGEVTIVVMNGDTRSCIRRGGSADQTGRP
jgi:DNA-binding response OmpR family regulator